MSELIHNFGIDWKLLLAQAVNFFVLLFLLQRFAYKPILKMLKKRKEEIEKGLEFTKAAKEELKKTGELREETLKQAQTEALALVTVAEETGKKKKEEILSDAHRKVEGIVADAKRVIEEEKAKMGQNVQKNAEELVRAGVAKVLGRLSPEERDAYLIKEALKELKSSTNY